MGRFSDETKKLIEENDKTVDENAKKKIDNATAARDSNIQTAEQEYADAERAATEDYISVINSIDLQKALDIKDIQETRANMGLSRSGISATEQTAAVLAAGNRANATRNQLQKTVDSLTKSLAEFKIGQEQALQSTILSVNEAADKYKAEYNKNVMANAHEQHQTMLKGLGLDSDILVQAIEQGMDGDEAVAAQVTKNNGIIDAMCVNGEITAEVRDYAKENGYTPDQTKEYQKLVTENENEKTRVSQLNGWLQDGTIDYEVFLKYIDDKTAPLSAVLLAQDEVNDTKKKEAAAKKTEENRVAYIKKLYDDGVIDYDVYLASITDSTVTPEGALLNMMKKTETAQKNTIKANNDAVIRIFNSFSDEEQQAFGKYLAQALENGWTPSQFYNAISGERDTVKNLAALEELRSTGQIDQATYDAAVANGTNANEALATYTKQKEEEAILEDKDGLVQQTIGALIDEFEDQPTLLKKGRQEDSLVNKVVNEEVSADYVEYICNELGLDSKSVLQKISKILADKIAQAAAPFRTDAARDEKLGKLPKFMRNLVSEFKDGRKNPDAAPSAHDLPNAVEIIKKYNLSEDEVYDFLLNAGFDIELAHQYTRFM